MQAYIKLTFENSEYMQGYMDTYTYKHTNLQTYIQIWKNRKPTRANHQIRQTKIAKKNTQKRAVNFFFVIVVVVVQLDAGNENITSENECRKFVKT